MLKPPSMPDYSSGNYGPMSAVNLPQAHRKKYELRPQRNEQEITRLKNMVKLKHLGNVAQAVDSEEEIEVELPHREPVSLPVPIGGSQEFLSASPVQEEDPFNKKIRRTQPQPKARSRRNPLARPRQRKNQLVGWMHQPMGEIVEDSGPRISSEEPASESERSRSREKHKERVRDVIDLELEEGESVEIVGGWKQ